VSKGYTRGKSARVAKRPRELISHPKSHTFRFATFASLHVTPGGSETEVRPRNSRGTHPAGSASTQAYGAEAIHMFAAAAAGVAVLHYQLSGAAATHEKKKAQ
jgi:hypothetical protein